MEDASSSNAGLEIVRAREVQKKDGAGIFAMRVGRTPIVRARRLAVRLGISGELYLKLEGGNPSRSKHDRVALLHCRRARELGFERIVAGSVGHYGAALARASHAFGLKCAIYIPRKDGDSALDALRKEVEKCGGKVLEGGAGLEECVKEASKDARENGGYDANPGGPNAFMEIAALGAIANEAIAYMKEAPDAVFVSCADGSTAAGMHHAFRGAWMNGAIPTSPRIFVASAKGGNAIVECYIAGKRTIERLDNRDNSNANAGYALDRAMPANGQVALDAIFDSRGGAYGVSDEELTDASAILKECENIEADDYSTAGLAALKKALEDGSVKNEGKFLVVLDTGRTIIEIRRMAKDRMPDNMTMERFIATLDEWLQGFTDPKIEMDEAVANAFEKGFVLGAFQNSRMLGICILTRMQFDKFFPHYHLAYIATDNSSESKGIGTRLIEEAIEVTGGSVSLHVETSNDKAIKLYEKMGFHKKYYRMLYAGPKAK